jgi:hypothetical protein
MVTKIESRAKPETVVVVIHADGSVEVFGDKKRVSIDLVHVPNAGQSVEAGLVAEQLVEGRLSPQGRRVYYPGNRLTQGHTKACRRASEVLWASVQLDVISQLEGTVSPC